MPVHSHGDLGQRRCERLVVLVKNKLALTDLPPEITGPNAPLTPIKQTACHPSTGGAGYQVALIETQNVASEEVSSDNVPFFFSMTPVMTIFYKSPGAGFKLESQPEAHLSCLKVVEDSTVSPSAQNAATMLLPRLSFRTALFVLGLSAIALG